MLPLNLDPTREHWIAFHKRSTTTFDTQGALQVSHHYHKPTRCSQTQSVTPSENQAEHYMGRRFVRASPGFSLFLISKNPSKNPIEYIFHSRVLNMLNHPSSKVDVFNRAVVVI
jgi:hypothetical protein